MRLATCNCPLATRTKTPVPPKMGGRGCLREYSTRDICQKEADEAFRKALSADGVFQAFTSLEDRYLHSRDADLLAWVAWVNTRAGGTLADAESAKTGDGNRTTFFKSAGDEANKAVEHGGSGNLGNASGVCELRDDFCFCHRNEKRKKEKRWRHPAPAAGGSSSVLACFCQKIGGKNYKKCCDTAFGARD